MIECTAFTPVMRDLLRRIYCKAPSSRASLKWEESLPPLLRLMRSNFCRVRRANRKPNTGPLKLNGHCLHTLLGRVRRFNDAFEFGSVHESDAKRFASGMGTRLQVPVCRFARLRRWVRDGICVQKRWQGTKGFEEQLLTKKD